MARQLTKLEYMISWEAKHNKIGIHEIVQDKLAFVTWPTEIDDVFAHNFNWAYQPLRFSNSGLNDCCTRCSIALCIMLNG